MDEREKRLKENPNIIIAPFDEKQVENLNFFQESGVWHQFTCAGKIHESLSPALIATQVGWKCPDQNCDYTQDWAHKIMADRPLLDNHLRFLENLGNEIIL